MPPRIWCAFALLVFVLRVLAAPAGAATLTWQAATPANWFDPANWSGGAVPTSADTALVNNGGQAQFAAGAASASVLQLGTNVGDVGSLSLTGGQLTATTAYVGYAGTGSVVQTGGTLTGSTFYVTYNSKSAGSYALQGPATLSFGTESVGGPFTQAGGLNSASFLYVGGACTYDLSGGDLRTTNTSVGVGSYGTFTQSGGNHRVTGNLYVGDPGGTLTSIASGTYNLRGNGSLSCGSIFLGGNNSFGALNLSGDASLFATEEHVGNNGRGEFVHNSGMNTVHNLYVGNGTSALGSYALGDAAFLSASYVRVDNGTFKQTGGTVSLFFGTANNSMLDVTNGSYAIGGTAASLSGNGAIHIANGASSTGTFAHAGGTVSTNGQPLYLAEGTSGSLATYTLSAGSLATGAQYIGHTGTGTFDQSGGTNRAGTLYLGYNSNTTSPSTGSYALSNNAQLFSLAQYHAYGSYARSTFTQSGGTNNLGANPLYLAYAANSSASYALSAGTLLSANQYVGYVGTATFTHTGGTNDLGTATLSLGSNSANAKGVYLLTGPDAVLLAGAEDVGPGGASLFRQSAGSNSTGTLTVRANSRYELSGGSLQVTNSLTNSGTLDLLAGSLSTPSLVNNGTLTLAAPASLRAPASPALASLTGTGSATVAAGATLSAGYLQQSALTVAGTVQLSSPTTLSTLSSLTLSAGSRLDLTTNTLRVSTATPGSTTASQIRPYLHDSLLLSSTANSDPLNLLTLGYLFDPGAKTITIKTAPIGDANFDGKVTADDYALIDKGFAQHLSFWSNGDFNYDGVVDQADYFLLDRAAALRSGTLAPDLLALRESQFGGAYVADLLVMIPEPSLAACFLAIPLAARRYRRR